jgi:hypothetical protein
MDGDVNNHNCGSVIYIVKPSTSNQPNRAGEAKKYLIPNFTQNDKIDASSFDCLATPLSNTCSSLLEKRVCTLNFRKADTAVSIEAQLVGFEQILERNIIGDAQSPVCSANKLLVPLALLFTVAFSL